MILEERNGAVVVFTMKGDNDLNLGVMNDELFDAVERYFDDKELRCAILTGAGGRAFSAGADLKGVAAGGLSGAFWTPRRKCFLDADGPRKPIVAAVNGHAIGAGMMIALACDIRIAAENATFGLPEVKYGFPPVLGATQRLAKLAPPGPVMQILMTGASITAAQAERWGIVNEVTPRADLMQRAGAIAGAIAANPPLAVQACRELATRGRELTLADGMRLELALSHLTRASQDSKEALSAYVEKRAPVFRGE